MREIIMKYAHSYVVFFWLPATLSAWFAFFLPLIPFFEWLLDTLYVRTVPYIESDLLFALFSEDRTFY